MTDSQEGFDASEAAKALGRRGGLKGGPARAEKLTAEQRSEIARNAVKARWEKRKLNTPARILKATHSGILKIGDIELPCAVLEDGTRVFNQSEFLNALGRSRKPAGRREDDDEQLPAFLVAKNLKRFISEELRESSRPLVYEPKIGDQQASEEPPRVSKLASGFRVELLPQVCRVYLDARDAGELMPGEQHGQKRIAARCDMLIRGFATVGIVALVDEATGYQDTRARDALAKVLEQFVAKEIQHIVKCFPLEYYKGLCKLWNVPFSPDMKMPRYFGHLTNNIVYARLAPAVLEEIQRKNPVVNGRRKSKHYQWLTKDVGHPRVQQLLGSICTIMDFADGDKEQFWKLLDRRHPKYKDLPLFRDLDLEE